MYNVSNDYLDAVKQPIQHHRLTGTIGSSAFTDENIVSGSFHITNQCTDDGDVMLGAVYTGTLTATFHDMPIRRYNWVNKVITVSFGLLLEDGETWEDVPLGIYTIKEAKHSAEGVTVTAYDNMIKLDKKFDKDQFQTPQKMYGFITTVCNKCGVTLGMTEGQIQAMPNGNTLMGIVGTESNTELNEYGNDIDTYRDLVFWMAQTMACFATINRSGQLVFKSWPNEETAVDEVSESYRLEGAVFDDFTTNYTGIYVTNSKSGNDIYYGYDVETLEAEIETVEGNIRQYNLDLAQNELDYQQGLITEAEYKRRKKALQKKIKQANTRLAWLEEALEKAEQGEDGLFMSLGENPFMQPDGVGSQYPAMRRRVLAAILNISYTPFTCSTVVGVHYDLGDIIQFTGGHATEEGESCCLMSYDFNFDGEYQMQGFGSDPNVPVIRSATAKSANQAEKNAGIALTKAEEGGGGGGGVGSYTVNAYNHLEMLDYTGVT